MRRIWYWYEVNGVVAEGNAKIKLYEAWSLLSGGPTVSSAIVISANEDGSGSDVLRSFINEAYKAIRECLGAKVPLETCSLGLTQTENY